ncbi:RHS repeat-associated core domain-containing protein [Morganella morganii]|uniref:RHS repeat-associated core domain-containing protein n=1 Tax=Morganella morganii TaxID=582 RepID=UPI0024B97E85|nr:RHS repeat-associated core domain-containing protein [Morganella morganii]ELB1546558.1 RHS repeat protein [Morganella morganii]BEP21891.1 RHS repeat-associated core domain-containing protein [Morganella morganii subsp. sibonii]HDS6841770.1 RHS repeat protein [Morganella morganii subsp. morganii]HDU8309045.1 RHS repeat protein [Morganella morganii subsp. sibonii]
MGNEFHAAKLGDELFHQSMIADFVNGVVKGAAYVGLFVAAGALTAGTGGLAAPLLAIAGGFVLGDVIDEVADTVSGWVDDALNFCGFGRSADGTIISGSLNVKTKDQPAARAAGIIPHEKLIGSIIADTQNPPKGKARSLAEGVLQKAYMLTPVGMGSAVNNLVSSVFNPAEPVENDPFPKYPSPDRGFFEGFFSPTVANKNPYAAPVDNDQITCEKWHIASAPYYLAEGSKKVQINSQPACRNGDRSTCEAKIDHTQESRVVRIGGNKEVVRDIISGRNPFCTFVGEAVGAVLGGWASIIRKGGMAAVRQCLSKAGCSLVMELAGNIGMGLVISGLTRSFNAVTRPVHAATGSKVLSGDDDLDFVLEGRYPLAWHRIYQSSNTRESRLGTGWALPFDVSIEIDYTGGSIEDAPLYYHDMSGRRLSLGELALGQDAFYVDEGFRVYRSLQNIFLLESDTGDYQLFETDPQRNGWLRLAQSHDRHGNTLFYRYSPEGQLCTIQDNSGLINVQLHYTDDGQRLLSVSQSDPDDERTLVSYQYDEHQFLVAVMGADGKITRRFARDDDTGLMNMHVNAAGLQSHYRWAQFDNETDDEQRPVYRVAEHWLQTPDGGRPEHTLLHYSPQERTLRTELIGLGETFRRWNEQHQITEFTDESGATWLFDWDQSRKLKKATDPLGHIWQYTYDERGNLTAETDPNGDCTTTEWDKDFAFPLIQVMPNGAAHHWFYNAKGDIHLYMDPLGHATRLVWDEQGDCLQQTDPRGSITRYRYNTRGQLTRYTDCSGYHTTLAYDDRGQLVTITDALSQTTRYHWSEGGQLLREELPDGRDNRYSYDDAGRVTGFTDSGDKKITFARNIFGQITERTDPAGHRLGFRYDRFGRLKALVNEKEESYRFEYDAQHRLICEQDLIGQKKQYQYDAGGNLIRREEIPALPGEEPVITQYQYDPAGRLITRENRDYCTGYQYGKTALTLQRVPAAVWSAAQLSGEDVPWQDILEFEYDLNGQMLSEQNSAGVYRHSYDDNGNLSSTELPDGQSLSYLYYGSGHLQQMNWREHGKQTVLAEYSRDRLHRETNRLSGGLDQRTEYDSSGRITAQIARLANSTRVTAATIDKRYTWDKHNNLTERSVSYGQADSPLTQGHWQYETYRYDPLGQLTRRLNGFSEELFLYDEAANLLGHQRQVAFNNQVTTSEEYDYTYDGFGRMAQRRVRDSAVCQHYHYDAEHRITAVTFEHDPQGHQRAEYDYDILGRRTGKRVWQSAQAQRLKQPPENRAPEETVQFCWNGLRLAAEKSSKSAHLTLHYVYNSGSYNPLARIESFDHPEKQTTDISYYHVALNGLPEELTDSQGRIIWHGDYSLWGKLKREQHPVAGFRGQQNLRFQGQYFDRETGLHYNTFRYYAPDAGRFTQQDPIGLAGGLNLYQYAPNPLMWVDPWGLNVVVVRYMGEAEVKAVSEAKGLVLNNKSSKKAIWVNTGNADFNPSGAKHRVTLELGDKSAALLNGHVDISKSPIDWRETGLPNGIISKTNEVGARGIGVDVLDDINKDIKKMIIEEKGKNGKWKVVKC